MSYEKLKRKGWINGTDVDIFFSQIAVVSYSHSVEESNPYIESSHNGSLSWTLPLVMLLLALQRQSIRVSFLKKSNLSCERSSMKRGGDGGNPILHLFGRAVGSAGTHILFWSCQHLFVRVSCEFAGSTCCNLHAEHAGVCSLEASMVKRAIRESGTGNMEWRFENDARHPLIEWVNIFWQFGRILKHSWSLIVDPFISDFHLFSMYPCPNFILRKSLLTLRACAVILLHRICQPSRWSDDLR